MPTTDKSKREPETKELQRLRDYDRQRHIEQSIEAGMSREEAERHADLHMRERDLHLKQTEPHDDTRAA